MGSTKKTKHDLRRIPPLWALAAIPLSPLVFPPVLAMYFGLFLCYVNNEPLWAWAVCLAFIGGLALMIDHQTRGCINDNVLRVESAVAARNDAAKAQEPAALILRAFKSDVAHSDPSAAFSLIEIMEPALRWSGYRPVALGRNIPLTPRHGVAIIETAEETWWEVFTEVATAAAVIVAFPYDAPSLRRELRWIAKQGMLDRLVLLMVPEALPVIYYAAVDGAVVGPAADNERRAQAWSRFQRIWRKDLKIELPHYDPRGALILFERDGTVSAQLLRTEDERPSWITAARSFLDYGHRYDVNFGVHWRYVVRKRGWTGPPVCELWRRLAPPPLHIDSRAYLHPPGSTGMEWRELKITMASGWGAALGALMIAAGVLVWRLL